MTTIFNSLPGFIADGVSEGGPQVFLSRAKQTDAELALFNEPSLVSCLLPENYEGEDKWYDVIGSRPWALPSDKAFKPGLITSGVGGRPYLKFGSGAATLEQSSPFVAPLGSNYWPIGADYAIVSFFKTDGDNGGTSGAIVGQDRITTTQDNGERHGTGKIYLTSTNGQIGWYHESHQPNGTANPRILNTPSSYPATAGMNMFVHSYKNGSPGTGILRINNAQISSNTNVTQVNRSNRAIVGGNYDGVTMEGGLRYGELYGVMFFNLHIADAANTAILNKLNNFASARWGIF